MNKRIGKYIITVVLSLLLVLFLFYAQQNHTEKRIIQNQFTTEIKPLYLPDISVDEYPVTSVKPTDPLYFTTLAKERIDTISEKFTSLFFADKRASEMQKWGDELTILRTVDKDPHLDSLLSWWNKNAMISWGNTKIYGSWESELARYALSIQAYKKTVTDMSLEASLISTMIRDQEGIATMIHTMSKDEKDIDYLDSLQKNMFRELKKNIKIPESAFDPYHMNYPIDILSDANEFGTYTAAIDVPKSISKLAEIQLQIDNRVYDAQDRLHTDYEGHTTFVYKDLPLTKNISSFSLLIPQNITYKPSDWKSFASPHSVYIYGYTASLPNPVTDVQYLLRYGDINERSLLTVDLDYIDTSGNKQRADIFESETPFHSIGHYLKFSSPVNKFKKGTFTFTILSKKILSQADLDNYNISVIPVISPVVRLARTDEQLVSVTTHKSAKELIYISVIMYMFALATIWIPLQKVKTYISSLRISEHRFVLSTRHHVKMAIRQGKKIWLTATCIIVLIDVLLADKRMDIVVLTVVLLWIFTLVGYNIPSNFNFFITLILLVPYLFFMMIDRTDMAEKIAVYVYVSFVIGLLHSATLLLKRSPVTDEIEQLEEESSRFINRFLSYVYSIIMSSYKFIMKCLHAYFVIPAKTTRDHIMNIVKLFIVVIVICMITATGILTIRFIKSEIRKKQRADQDPVIVKVEPTIVYRATKILVKGRNHGWSENGNVKLMNGNKEVVPDVWTDTRIIFTVPLQWKEGINNIRIEKKIFWEGKEITAVSNSVPIKLINAGSTFTPDDDAYFEQLKHVDPEVLKLNGYDTNEQK